MSFLNYDKTRVSCKHGFSNSIKSTFGCDLVQREFLLFRLQHRMDGIDCEHGSASYFQTGDEDER